MSVLTLIKNLRKSHGYTRKELMIIEREVKGLLKTIDDLQKQLDDQIYRRESDE